MAKFRFDTPEEKASLVARAKALKPRGVANVVATSLGWAVPQINGNLELLVSFSGLDELLGDVTPEVIDPTPLEVKPEVVVEEKVEEKPEVKVEVKPEVVEAPKKKGGRPPKVHTETAQ